MSDSPFKQRLLREAAEDFNYSLGNAALARNALDEAVILFRRALDVRPGNGKVLHNLALALQRLNCKEDAAAAATAAPQISDFVQGRCDLAQTYEIQGQKEAAVDVYGEALAAVPDHAQANYRLGQLLISLDRTAEAMAHFRRLLAAGAPALESLDATQLASVGRALTTAGEHADAERVLRVALAMDPSSIAANLGLARLLPALGRFEECAAVWGRLVQLAPQSISYRVFLAESLFNIDQLAEAEQVCRQILAMDPKQARENNVPLQLGKIKLHQGEFVEAESWLNQALADNPAPQTAAFIQDHLGSACLAQGRIDQAETCQQAALALAPHLAGIKVRLGLTKLAQGRIDEAMALHQECATAHPDNDYFISTLGLSLHCAGRIDEAIAAHRRALDLNGLAAWQWDNLGLALAAAGQPENALEAHRQAVRYQPNRVLFEARMRPWATAALFDAYRVIGFSQ